MSTDRAIWNKFHIKRGDNLPYTGWAGTRVELAELFGELGFTKGAEIGVRAGEYSEVLLQKNPNLELLCIDTWASYYHAGNTISDEKQESYYKLAIERLSKYSKAKIMRMSSMEAAQQVPDKSLDFVYVDALHDFDHVMVDIITWAAKVKSGGIVSGHDYKFSYQQGVVYAVDAYTRAHNIQSWYLTIQDKEPSWVWVS